MEPLDGDVVADPESALPDDAVAMSHLVEHLLGVLDAPRLAVIVLRYWGGQTDTEIAETLTVPLGTAKTWLRAALQLLAEHLERLQGEQSGEICVRRSMNTALAVRERQVSLVQLRALFENASRTGRQAGFKEP